MVTVAELYTQIKDFFANASGDGGITLPIGISDVSGLSTTLSNKVETSMVGVSNGVATLGSNGKIPATQIDFIGAEILSISSQVARLALPISTSFRIVLQGDTNWLWAINKNLDPSVSGNWVDCGSASAQVVSVNTKTGTVTLTASDVGAVAKSDFTAKGNLLSGTGNGTYAVIPVGTNGQFLVADSTISAGAGYKNTVSTMNVTGFTKLGSDDPAIKMKKFTFTTLAEGVTLSVPTGLTSSKILDFSVLVQTPSGTKVAPDYGGAGSLGYYRAILNASGGVDVFVGVGATNMVGRPGLAVVTYEE